MGIINLPAKGHGSQEHADHSNEVIRLYAFGTAFGKTNSEIIEILTERGLAHPETKAPFTAAYLNHLKQTHTALFTRYFNEAYHRKLTEAAPHAERVLEDAMYSAPDVDSRIKASSAYLNHLREMRRHLMPELMDIDAETLQPNRRLTRTETEDRVRQIVEAAKKRTDAKQVAGS